MVSPRLQDISAISDQPVGLSGCAYHVDSLVETALSVGVSADHVEDSCDRAQARAAACGNRKARLCQHLPTAFGSKRVMNDVVGGGVVRIGSTLPLDRGQ